MRDVWKIEFRHGEKICIDGKSTSLVRTQELIGEMLSFLRGEDSWMERKNSTQLAKIMISFQFTFALSFDVQF